MNGQAITIWIDESTDIKHCKNDYNLVGYLITNSDIEEFRFLNRLVQARKVYPTCWSNMHGNNLRLEERKITLLKRWLAIFKEDPDVYFHCFFYEKNGTFISKGETYEHYFAKQSVFSLGHKMKKNGAPINTIFKDVSTVTILFDRRRAHSADIIAKDTTDATIERFNKLENIYKDEISKQLSKISGKNNKNSELTVRFSFISSDCFNALQFSDCILYLIRKKIELENGGAENEYTKIFDKFFLGDLNNKIRALGFRKIYEYDKKFNFFESKNEK